MTNIDRFRFRIWDKKGKKMFTHDTIKNFSPVVDVEKIDLKRYVPMQSIGKKDKNNKLIYEGDIIRIKPDPRERDVVYYEEGFNFTALVKYAEDGMRFDLIQEQPNDYPKYFDIGWLASQNEIEILGNKFEDLELIIREIRK